MNANKAFHKKFIAVRQLWEIYLNRLICGPVTAFQTLGCDWSLYKFIEVNLSKLTHNNQIFKNDFICIHYHLCKTLSQITECKILLTMISLKWTLYNTIYFMLILYKRTK